MMKTSLTTTSLLVLGLMLTGVRVFSQCEDYILPVITAESVITTTTSSFPQPSATYTDDSEVTTSVLTTVSYSETDALLTPDIGLNLCNYQQEAAFMFFLYPAAYKYWTVSNGFFETFENGTAHFTCVLTNNSNPNGQLAADVWLQDGMNWTEWANASEPHGFKADCGGIPAQHENWMYYIVSSSSHMSGLGDYAGSYLNLTHAPVNQFYGYQLGLGGNNYSAQFGSGGWVTSSGTLIDNSTNQTFTNSSPADFMFLHEYAYYDAVIQTTYYATDICGNTSFLNQTVQMNHNPGPILTNMPLAGTIMEVCDFAGWQPTWVSHCDGEIIASTDLQLSELITETPGLVTVLATATDACGMTSTFTFEIWLMDTLPCNLANCVGDFNGDGIVTSSDVGLFMGGYSTAEPMLDINADNDVNMMDFLLVLQNFGNLCGE